MYFNIMEDFQISAECVTPTLSSFESYLDLVFVEDVKVRNLIRLDEQISLSEIYCHVRDIWANFSGSEAIEKVIQLFKKHLSERGKKSTPSHYLFVLLSILRDIGAYSYWTKYVEYNQFFEQYCEIMPELFQLTFHERQCLVKFANWMNITKRILEPRFNKGIFLVAITKIVEGPDVHYVTGTGQTASTTRRVKLYETECNISPMKRLRRNSESYDEFDSKIVKRSSRDDNKSSKMARKSAPRTQPPPPLPPAQPQFQFQPIGTPSDEHEPQDELDILIDILYNHCT